MYKTTVLEIGELASSFAEERLVILFGPEATSELRAISVIHEGAGHQENLLAIGRKISFGNQEYEIIEVGAAANKNFAELGHVSVYFGTASSELLPGAIIVGPKELPVIEIGDTIEIKD
jgi:PTS system glucitol/sorbitol-specific IIA component